MWYPEGSTGLLGFPGVLVCPAGGFGDSPGAESFPVELLAAWLCPHIGGGGVTRGELLVRGNFLASEMRRWANFSGTASHRLSLHNWREKKIGVCLRRLASFVGMARHPVYELQR